jgi:hypothetical protein
MPAHALGLESQDLSTWSHLDAISLRQPYYSILILLLISLSRLVSGIVFLSRLAQSRLLYRPASVPKNP